MNSRLLIGLIIVLLAMSCKDNEERPMPVVEEKVEVEKKIDLDEFYQPMITEDGDTLLSYIPQDSVELFFTRYGKKNPEKRVEIETKYGKIQLELFEQTPLYRASFIYLVKNGYYDETVVHRVVPDFIVQAGDSDRRITATKRSSAGNYMLPPAILDNVQHTYGTVSAAKRWEDNPENWHNPFDFFITLGSASHLDGEHTIFGKVTSGMDVAEKISRLNRDEGDWPIETVYIDMKVID
ncbi:peptidylprolyl isomerase [Nonlabens ponticola]|uniref:Peptidyl-prolyl cis-trans isomerase n=1 Tax=Nonlabens ponticola TaxID=2496866 RepID=A0A3S9MY49_9FLAO|nr:peptidylprolyl isomerase [Nonlabens ponticola]AZQ44059.1 peptidylprolyl isomerase [Nonlabens ponticola]